MAVTRDQTLSAQEALNNLARGTAAPISGTLANGQATVTTAVTLRAANNSRRSITIKALTGGGTLYVGSTSAVATGDGFEVKGGESLTLTRCTGAIFVVASASTDVRWIEEAE